MHGTLVLFDVDGTLLDTRGAGMAALRRAARELHGQESPELDLAGATDSGIVRGILEAFGVEASEENVAAYYACYLLYLEENLAGSDYDGEVLPGVVELLAGLEEAGATLGLLTGNIARGAALKVGHFGLGSYFEFGAYGDDHHDRNELGPIALRRAQAAAGRAFAASATVIVGDTPKDIACGKALGATTLCVATGSFTVDQLREAGGDVVVDDLAATGEIVDELRRMAAKSG